MTCIVGILDRQTSCAWMGGDSAAATRTTSCNARGSKVFHNKDFPEILIGATTSFRHIDLLRYCEGLFSDIKCVDEVDHEYMCSTFVPNIRRLFNEHINEDNASERSAMFMVATPFNLFVIQPDYSVIEYIDDYFAIGCGDDFAMGSLSTTQQLAGAGISILFPRQRILFALEAAAKYALGVEAPFVIRSTDCSSAIDIS